MSVDCNDSSRSSGWLLVSGVGGLGMLGRETETLCVSKNELIFSLLSFMAADMLESSSDCGISGSACLRAEMAIPAPKPAAPPTAAALRASFVLCLVKARSIILELTKYLPFSESIC